METPDFVVDVHNRLWQYDDWVCRYKCLTTPALDKQELSYLISYFGPIHELEQGKEILPPFKPIANGTWVQVDVGPDADPINGRVKSYDDGKLFYEIIILAPRGVVKEME